MKKNFTRLMAALMLVCMLLSMVVPATFAEDPAQPETLEYNFQLYGNTDFQADATDYSVDAATGRIAANFDANGKYDGSTRVYTWFYNNYGTKINWGIETSSGQYATVKDYYFRGTNNQGLRLLTGDSKFVSLRIAVPTPGDYNMNLKVGSTASVADVYIFPATTAYGSKTLTPANAITAAMADTANLVKENVDLTAEGNISLGKKSFATAGDYIVVFKADGNFANGVVLRSLTLTPAANAPEGTTAPQTTAPMETTAPEALGTDVDFKFDVVNDYAAQCSGVSGKYYTNTYSDGTVADYMASLYPDTLNWKYEGSDTGEVPQIRIRAAEGLRLYGDANNWIAFRLTGITEGIYDINITSTGGGNTVAAYLIPDSQALDIAAGLTAENLLKADVTTTATLAENKALSGGDYIVVFKTTAQAGNKYYRIAKLSFTAVTEEIPEETTTAPVETTTAPEETTTAPEVANPVPHSFDFKLETNDTYMAYVKEELVKAGAPADTVVSNHTLYKAEASGKSTIPYKWFNTAFPKTVNWGVEGVDSEQSGKFGADYYVETVNRNGLRVSLGKTTDGKAGWAAFRIKVNAAGIYKIDLNMLPGSDSNHIATGDILDLYIFEKFEKYYPNADNTAQIGEHLGEETYAGSLTYDESKTSYTIRSGYTFPKAGEYVIVLRERAVDICRYAHLDTLTLTPSDTADNVEVPDDLPKKEEFIPPEPDKDGDFTFDVVTNYPTICGGFNVVTYTNSAKNKSGNVILDENGKQMSTEAYMASLYAQEYIDWVLESYSFQNGKGVDNLMLRQNEGMRIYGAAGDWAAFRLSVPTAGEYNLKLTGTGTNTASLYLVKYTEGMEIAKAMTEENLLVANVSSAKEVAVQEKAKLEAGDYILIVEQKKVSNPDKAYWSLSRLQLETWKPKEAKPMTDKMVYDFDMVAMDSRFLKKRITNRLETGGKRGDIVIGELYEAGKLHWKYENTGAGNTDMTFRENALRIRSKTINYNSIEDAFVAFRIKNPGTGKYDVRLTSGGASFACMNVYILPLKNTMVLTPEQIKAEMTKDNLLVANARVDAADTFYLGDYTFGMEDEYLLVFELTKGTAFFLNKVELTKDGMVADSTILYGKTYKGIVYDLDLADAMDGIYPESKVYMPDVIDDMNTRWRNGTMNWKWVNASDGLSGSTPATEYDPTTNLRFYRAGGMRLYSAPDSWMALKIKSPGSGDFTITLNHATMANSGTIAMYILPADTDINKLWEATDPENRVGKVYLGNEDGGSAIEDGKTSFVGYWNFEAGKEYILVIEGYEKSRFNSKHCYMNLSQIIMERGIVSYKTAEDEKRVEPITVLENAVPVMDLGTYGACAEINGHDYMFLPVEGGYMPVYDLDTYTLVDNVKTDVSYTRNVGVTPDNKIVLAHAGKFLGIYDPYTKEYEKSPVFSATPGLEEVGVLDGIAIDENGTIWLGSHYGATVFTYNIETREFKSYGQPVGYQVNLHGIMCKDGYLYGAASGATESVVFKMDCATGKLVAKQDITHLMGTAEYIHSVNLIDEYIILGGSYLAGAIVLMQDTLELTEIPGLVNHPNLNVSEEINGKHYMVLQGYGLYEYDKATKTVSKTPGFGTSGVGFRTGGLQTYGTSLITIDGDPCLVTYSGGQPKHFNLNTQEYYSYEGLMKPEHGKGGAKVRGFVSWAEGTNQFSFGAFNTTLCTVFNTETGKVDYYYNTGGQTDSQVWYEGKLYAGNYSSTTLNEIYPDPNNLTNEVIQRWRLDHEETGQKRIHTLTAGDGYVFAGTTPDSNLSGGGITVYDTRTGRWKFYRNPVENGSIMSLAYHDELVYGATSCSGGSGSGWKDGLSAVVFVYDYKNNETVAVLDPRDYIKGLASPVYHVRCVVPDPNVEENGRIWSMVSETLFCFTFDKETKKFDVQEVISFDKSTYASDSTNNWFPKTILFDAERNYIYAAFHGNGGTQRIELSDWNAEIGSIQVKSNMRIMSDIVESSFMVMGEDGNLYYGYNTSLKMLPLNVTDEDWAISQKVDDLILAIGEEITVESEAAIRTARSAYENLSWRYKTLVQKLETLQEAESDILERKIDTIVLEDITAESFPAMTELLDEYLGLNARQQRYVKNYAQLKEAYDKASDLNDQKIAAALQKRIDALADKFPLTLDNEPEVVEIRGDYKQLTGKQAMLVDTTILEDAEAQIAVLRAEFVKYVESLIQKIPAEITLDAEPAIVAAREAADKLYVAERKEVSYSKLTSAEGKLRTLKNAKAKAEEVDALIDAIGIVTLGDKERIAEAREAYDALNGTALTFVTKTKKLETAEFILKALQTWGIPAITVVNAGIVFAVLWFVPSLHAKVFKTKKKEEAESIDN